MNKKSTFYTVKELHMQTPTNQGDLDDDVVVESRFFLKTGKPSLYKTIILNDDYTPMEFVVAILENIFYKNLEEAIRIMLHVHKNGMGVSGIYPYEVAESKVKKVMIEARKAEHPLQCVLVKE